MRPTLESARESGHRSANRLGALLRGAALLTLSLAACAGRPPASLQAGGAPLSPPTTPVPQPTGEPAPQETPDAAIATLDLDDPGSPLALNAHLEYADQLLRADDVDCEQRLSIAQSQVDVAAADPSFSVILPLGLAQLADLQYRIHLGRASCPAWAPQRATELQQALTSAQHAVDLYREVLDYKSMTIAQFNVAVTQRLLGDDGASVVGLEAAIALDEEFGLRQDAADNTRLLEKWRGDSARPNAAGAATEFPPRAVTLKSWRPNHARLSLRIDEAAVIDTHITRDHANRTFEQRVRRDLSSWIVSYEPGAIDYAGAQWPEEIPDVRELAISFERGLGIPAIQVSLKGDFERVPQVYAFSQGQLAATRALIHDHRVAADGTSHLGGSDQQAMSVAFTPATVQSGAAEDYNLQVGIWSGATLEQGVWYKLAAPLTLPGVRQLLAANDIEFAYTRDVPCTGAVTLHSCVEIVVHLSPQPEAIQELLNGLSSGSVTPLSTHVRYWAATYIRIVTDPETLDTRVYDVRRYWHVSDKKAVQERFQNRSERIVTTLSYP